MYCIDNLSIVELYVLPRFEQSTYIERTLQNWVQFWQFVSRTYLWTYICIYTHRHCDSMFLYTLYHSVWLKCCEGFRAEYPNLPSSDWKTWVLKFVLSSRHTQFTLEYSHVHTLLYWWKEVRTYSVVRTFVSMYMPLSLFNTEIHEIPCISTYIMYVCVY